MKRVSVAIFVTLALGIAWGQEAEGFRLNDAGLAAASRGEYAEAERLYEQALPLWKALGPQYDAHLATTQGNLAETLCMQGKRSEGARLFEQSLATHRRLLGPTNLRTLTIMNLLGGAYLMVGDDVRSSALFEEALHAERELYPNDLQLARSLAGLGLLRLRENKAAESLALAEEALGMILKIGGEHTVDAAMAYANVAEAHRWLGHTDRALPLFRKAQSIYESILGPVHPRVASVVSQEGLIYMADGKYSLAEKEMLRSLDLLAKSCPNCTFEQIVGESNLGLLRIRQGKYEEADRLLSQVVSTEERYMTRPGSDMATVLLALAQIRQKQHRYEDAARLHRRADSILEFQ
ncbi:MAG TPA: tetratricopeptide repeat protein [Bryobacteraceae bacterium]|nr:tetratricopeptide repeat protein [Bryobacteraceae bacterium]